MCTLIAIHRQVPGAPLLVAANRDEFYQRPAEGPALRILPSGPVVAPVDVQAGGTWLGLNAQGVFAALTNRPNPTPDEDTRSRGWVVMDALAQSSARDAAEVLAKLPSDTYNPFNIFVADRRDAFALEYLGSPALEILSPGAHVVGNVRPNDRCHPKVGRVMERAEKAAMLPRREALSALREACREHDPGFPLQATCVHTEEYGTRSSFLIAVGETAEDSELHYADGPPCRMAYEDFTPLLHELSPGARYAVAEIAPRKTS